MENNINKKRRIIVFGIIFLIIILIGSTYAFFTYSRSLQAFTLTTNGITARFTEGTNFITFTGAYPISDEYALENLDKLTYVDFTVSGNAEALEEAIAYEIYLTEKSGNSLSSDYIKVYLTDELDNKIKDPKIYSSLSNTTYSKDASIGKVVFEDNQATTFSKNFRLYIWLDKDYTQNSVSQTFSFYVNLYAHNDENRTGPYLLEKKIASLKEENPSCNYVVEDYDTNEELEATYLSGPAPGKGDCAIDFNYVWWSGKMWRITAIYPDGAMKMVTDNNITTISFGENATYYNKETQAKSYMFQWLNEDFLDTLYNNGADVIDTTKSWNATMPVNETISKKPEKTDATMIPVSTSPVGLLNNYEYYMSYKNTTTANGYLNIGYYWWLLNPFNASYAWLVSSNGNGLGNSLANSRGVRPSIYLKSSISFSSGNGTKSSPYIISSDYSYATENDKLYTRHSGEYIKFDTDGNAGNYDNAPLFRIVGVEGEGDTRTTKIVAMDYADNKATKKFASTVNFGDDGNTDSNDYWDYYLNDNTSGGWLYSLSFKDKLVSGNYYLGLGTSPYYNYKKSICTTDTTDRVSSCEKQTSYPFMVGLLRRGEMFATQQGTGSSNSIDVSLITKYSSSVVIGVWGVVKDGGGTYYSPTSAHGVRPSYYLKSSTSILSGSGTELDPYIVS